MVVHDSAYQHYFRTAEGAWGVDTLPFSGTRPDLAGDIDGNLFLVYSSGGRLRVAKGTPDSSGTSWSWEVIYTRTDATEMGEGVYDRLRWESDRILSAFGQERPEQQLDYGSGTMIDGIPAPVHVIDLHVSSSAVLPIPLNGAGSFPEGSTLKWTPGQGSVAHQVYLGTSHDAVAVANQASPQYMGEFELAQVVPTGLLEGQTYYWRVDQKQADGSIIEGLIWSFTAGGEVTPDTWAGYPVSQDGVVDTVSWMGFINVSQDPYVWVYGLGQWMYLHELMVTPLGSWAYLMNQHPALIEGTASSFGVIQGDFQDSSPTVWLPANPNADRVGAGGSIQRINEPILGFTLPSIGAGNQVDAVNFGITMLSPANNSGATFTAVVSLMNYGQFTDFSPADFSSSVASLGNGTLVATFDNNDIADGAVMSFPLTGDALALFKSFYDVNGDPLQNEVWFRLSHDAGAWDYSSMGQDRYQFLDDGKGNVTRSLTIATSLAGDETWAGYPMDEAGDVDTFPWMGFLNANMEPYIWSYGLSQWMYVDKSIVTPNGSWVFIANI